MNREETKKAIEVMQAYVDGEVIERRNIGPPSKWIVIPTPNWERNMEYRIKPKPREVWINFYANGDKEGFTSRETANDYAAGEGNDTLETVKFVEVLEDE